MAMVMVSRWALSMASALGLLGHPVLQRDLEESNRRPKKTRNLCMLSHRLLGEVVYRCDLDTQFATHYSAGAVVDGRKKFIEKKNKENAKAILGNVGTVDKLRFLLASDHIQTQIAAMTFFTYNGRDGVTALSSRLGADVDGLASGIGAEGMVFTDDAGSRSGENIINHD